MLRSRSNQHLGINARIFYFHGLFNPSISFSNKEQIFERQISKQLFRLSLTGRDKDKLLLFGRD